MEDTAPVKRLTEATSNAALQPQPRTRTSTSGILRHSDIPSFIVTPSTDIMSTNRLFRFPKPAWLNTPNTRTAGVYLAGALVRPLLL